MADVKLYGYATSPYVRKVACFLYYKNITFKFIAVNPFNANATIGFTDQTRVPVLKIDDEWRTDSSPIGHWLDERFPEKPLLSNNSNIRASQLNIDNWLSESFIPQMLFRGIVDGEKNLAFRHRAWRLAELVNSQTPLPDLVRQSWPNLLNKTLFIQKMVAKLDLSEPLLEAKRRIIKELLVHFDGGPFFGGSNEPSMVDLTLFPQLVFGYMAGLDEQISLEKLPGFRDWIFAVQEYLPANPILINQDMIINRLQENEN